MMNRTILLTLVTLCSALSLSTAHADNIVWNGLAGNGSWTDGGNWVGGEPPENDDFSDTAVFNSTATPSTVLVPNGQNVRGIRFETVGWTIDVSGQMNNLQNIFSDGAGTNSLGRFDLRNNSTPGNWVINPGNTLHLTNSYFARSRDAEVSGGGLLLISGTPELRIEDATVRVEASTAFSVAGGFVRIDDPLAVLELQTSVANAESQIGDEIIDNTGLGLQVTDIGGGFVQIAVIPEPASLVLAMAGGLMLLGRRRR